MQAGRAIRTTEKSIARIALSARLYLNGFIMPQGLI